MNGVDQVVQSDRRLFRVSTKEELIESLFDEFRAISSVGTDGKGLLRSQEWDRLRAPMM